MLGERSESAAEFPEHEQHQRDNKQKDGWRSDDNGHVGKNSDEQRRKGNNEEEADNLHTAARFSQVVVVGLLVTHDEEARSCKHGDEADHMADIERSGDAHKRRASDEATDETVSAERKQHNGADGNAAHERANVALLTHFLTNFSDDTLRVGVDVTNMRGDAAAIFHLVGELFDDVKLDDQRLFGHQTSLVHTLEDVTHKGFVFLVQEGKKRFRLFVLFDFQLNGHVFSPFFCLANAAKDDTKNDDNNGDAAVNVFADAFNEIPPFAAAAGFNLLGRKTFAANPEEHNPSQQSTNRHDVDGEDVHPSADGVAVFKENTDEQTKAENNQAGLYATQAKQILQRFDWGFVEVHQRGDTCEEHGQEEHDGQKLCVWQLSENGWQHDEDERWAALWVNTKGKHRWQNGHGNENGCNQLEEGNHEAREHDVGVALEITAVDDGAAASQGQ